MDLSAMDSHLDRWLFMCMCLFSYCIIWHTVTVASCWLCWLRLDAAAMLCRRRCKLLASISNKKHLKNVGPIRYCEPLLYCQSPGVASRTPAIAIAQAACDVHNDNAWQRGLLWPHLICPISNCLHRQFNTNMFWIELKSMPWLVGILYIKCLLVHTLITACLYWY